ncbi:MAG TPA: ABC transporter permease, partial [Candidatus Limnocylindria bacterium]|nr:ABC transporter permease [Candidatus Limnocylindria bacterium]
DPRRQILLTLVVLPFWTSFLLRVYAWQGFLRSNGVINNFLLWTGIIDTPLVMLQTNFAVYLGIVYTYLPFMILPLYANLVKLDESLLEASADLGGRGWRTFWSVALPMLVPSIFAGSIFTFSLSLGDYITVQIVGGKTQLIGNLVYANVGAADNLPFAAALATIPAVIMVIYLYAVSRSGALEEL